jgi:hypothetical protein
MRGENRVQDISRLRSDVSPEICSEIFLEKTGLYCVHLQKLAAFIHKYKSPKL